jgi:hypothetical protein
LCIGGDGTQGGFQARGIRQARGTGWRKGKTRGSSEGQVGNDARGGCLDLLEGELWGKERNFGRLERSGVEGSKCRRKGIARGGLDRLEGSGTQSREGEVGGGCLDCGEVEIQLAREGFVLSRLEGEE